MFWVISCQICVWHHFGGHVAKDVFTNSLGRYISQVCEDHSWGIGSTFFGYVPHKICGGKCAGLVRPKKRSGICMEGIPEQFFEVYLLEDISQMTFSENNCERYSFFLPKKVCEGMFAFDISNIF